MEQTSWILFLKYLDDLENSKQAEAALAGKEYRFILAPEYHWNHWAVAKNSQGEKIYDGACGSAGFLFESFDK